MAILGDTVFNEESYLHKRIAAWQRLEKLLAEGGAGLKLLDGDHMVEAVRLYRQASGDLAYLSTHSSNADVVDYLNNLVGRAYTEIYRLPRRDLREVFAGALATSAQTVRRRSPEIFASLSIFFGAVAFAWILMALVPESRMFFVAPGMEENFQHWTSGHHDGRTGGESVMATSFYAGNNPRVAIMMMGMSLATCGAMGVVMLWQNGVLVGALAADCMKSGALFFLLSSIFPHGVSEIGGIIVAGGSSFVMGRALLAPGRMTRAESLKANGKDASALAVTALIMIALAAPIEGFFSFNPNIPQWLKLIAGTIALTAWLAFFIGYGREPRTSST